jgi:DNA-binding Lrp family transcriptional regulator
MNENFNLNSLNLDETDLQIIYELQRDGRLSNQELADRIGLSPSPCLRRVRALEQAGVITGYRAVVNPAKVGLAITAFVRLRMNSHSAEQVAEIEDRLASMPSVLEVYLLAGDNDYQLKIVVSSFLEYENFVRDHLRTMPALASISTAFAFGVIKSFSPLPLD